MARPITYPKKTEFPAGAGFLGDSNSGVFFMESNPLLEITSEKSLSGNVSPKFDPNKPNDAGGYAYYAGTNVTYEGKNYVFVVNHSSGVWNPSEVEQKPLSETINLQGVGQAVENWLNEHPEATTSVEDGSLTEQKFSDSLKLQTIKDYVTPEMFGAKGDGVTDDTSAFTAMVSASNKYVLIGKYVVDEITINKNFIMIGLTGNRLIAADKTQNSILNLTNGGKNCITGVNFNGGGSSDPNDRGDCVGVLLNANSTSEFLMEKCDFTYCKIGLYAPKTFWHSKVSLCRFNGCGVGISIGYATSPGSATYLELIFDQIYCNQCDRHIYLEYGTNIVFKSCSFGSEHLQNGSQFLATRYPTNGVIFNSCNFEGIYIADSTGAFIITSTGNIEFNNCYFHVVYPTLDADINNVGLFRFMMSGDNRILFNGCRFGSINIKYVFQCPSGAPEKFYLDWKTLDSISIAFSEKFAARGVYSTNLHVFKVTDIPSLQDVPSSPLWVSSLNNFFRGTTILKNKTNELYRWDGSNWVLLRYVPTLNDDVNTYTLKSVAGVLTWVQDA